MRKLVRDLPQEGLPLRLPASERVEPDGVGVQIDLRPDEAVAPGRVHGESMPQEGEGPIVGRAAQEDEAALRVHSGVEDPPGGERATGRSSLDAGSGLPSAGRDILGRLALHATAGSMLEARPDLRLPAALPQIRRSRSRYWPRPRSQWRIPRSRCSAYQDSLSGESSGTP